MLFTYLLLIYYLHWIKKISWNEDDLLLFKTGYIVIDIGTHWPSSIMVSSQPDMHNIIIHVSHWGISQFILEHIEHLLCYARVVCQLI